MTPSDKLRELAMLDEGNFSDFGRVLVNWYRTEGRQLAEDGLRYRWLRDSHNQGANSPTTEGIMVVTDRPSKEPRYIGPLAWQLLDAAIDAARSES